jgi:hypothetical protein
MRAVSLSEGRVLSFITPEAVFLKRCDQLAVLLQSNDPTDAIDIAARLRQLLADSKSLLDTVNKNQLPIRFKVGVLPTMPPGIPPPTIFLLVDSVDPEEEPLGGGLTLNKDGFLGHCIAVFRGQQITVRDVIRYTANVVGGVHHDPQPRPEYDAIKALSEVVKVFGGPAYVRHR